jgi:hypothetical protein
MMYDWFNAYLNLGQAEPIAQTDFWPLTQAEMTVFDEKHPRPTDAMDEPTLRKELRQRDRKMFEELLSGDFAKYRQTIGAAERIMLPPLETPVEVHSDSPESSSPEIQRTEAVVTTGQARIPLTVLRPAGQSQREKIVLWLDDAGRSHLFTPDGAVNPAVGKLLATGVSVASADLFLTPKLSDAPNLYEQRLSQPSPGHQSLSSDVENTAFVYGYNLTLLAQRSRDIQAVVDALQQQKLGAVILVGTGDAGLWTLLARTELPENAVANTIVDLQGFAFANIKSNKDQNMQPGALKYGGVGGLAALTFPAKLTLFGVNDSNAAEISPLKKIYESQ